MQLQLFFYAKMEDFDILLQLIPSRRELIPSNSSLKSIQNHYLMNYEKPTYPLKNNNNSH